MINSAALLPSLSRSSGLSPRSAIGLNIIRRDSIAVDRLLKERLVLSKVRYGIERQQQERERRRNREADLEADSKRNYEVGDAPNNPRKRRRGIGGLLGTVFGGILSSLGGVAFQAAPAFLLARNNIIKGGSNFNRTIGATDGLLNTIKGQKGPFDTLRKVKLNPVRNIGNTITRFGNSLTLFVNSAIAGQIGGRAIDRLGNRAGVRSQVSATSRAGVRAGKIDIEEALELRRSQENARARQRVNIMKKQQDIQAEAAAETAKRKSRSKARRSKVMVETAVGSPSQKIIKKTIQINNPEYARTGGGSGRPRDSLDDFINAKDPFNVKKKSSKKSVKINKFINKPIFTINGIQYEFDNDLVTKTGIFDDNYIPKEIKTIRNPDGSISTPPILSPRQNRIDQFFLQANDIHDKQNVAFGRDFSLVEPNDLKYMAKDILGEEDFKSPEFQSKFNEYKNDFKETKRLEKKLIKQDNIKRKRRTSKVSVSGRPGQKVYRRKSDGTITYRSGGLTNEDLLTNAGQRSTRNMFRDIDKVKAKKVVPKKGIGKFLSNIGGAQFLKPVKEFLGQGIKNIPFIGDLIGILLDVFVFGEPIQRALFLAGGSALGGFLGGLAGAIGGPPGILIGGIIGGIAGDLLGGAFYDLLFRRGQKGSAGQRFGASATKASIKAGLYTGGFAGYGTYMLGEGGREFVLDADSTAALEKRSPGFLMALNKARGAEAIGVIEDYASYDKISTGKEKMVPIPIPIPQKQSVQEIMMTDSEAGGGTGGGSAPITFFSEHYRRG